MKDKKSTTSLPAVIKDAKQIAGVSPLQLYLQEIAKYPLLTPEEEFEVAERHYQDDDVKSAHRLVTSNLRLVVKIANEFRQAQVSLLDLIQEGNYGLMQAVKKFNPYKGVKLSSYAAWWIKAYILKYIMDNRSQVKIGTTAAQRKLYYNLRKEAERLLLEYDSVDTKLLASNLDVKEKEVVEMQMRLAAPDFSLDSPIDSIEGGQTRQDVIPNDDALIEDQLSDAELKALFVDHLDDFRPTLRDRDREVLELRILSETPMTLQELGDRYGVSRERARQLEANVINKLRKFILDRGVIDI